MLAERRRKTKWTNLGRQALWNRGSGDATFGREMMEKMGWKAGQGLGANKQGIKEPLKISFKNDNKGVGFKDNDNEWIQQQSKFDEFLNKLSSENNELSKNSQMDTVQSLEERSRLSKARVHYHKFTRGKDLAKYSKKDLECILGRNEKETSGIPSNIEISNENVGTEDKSLITAGSMVDYFAKKMQSKKKKKDDSFDVVEPEIGENLLGSRSKDETKENVVEATLELNEKRGKKSKKKKVKDEDGCYEGPCDEVAVNDSDQKMKSVSEGGKKIKKTKIAQAHDQPKSFDESRVRENIVAEKEKEMIETPKEEENVNETNPEGDEVPSEKLKKKKKKRKKEEDLVEEFDTKNVEALNVTENKSWECEETEQKVGSLTSAEGVKKKKKTCKRGREVIIDEDEGVLKKKIKKKKKCSEAENPFNDEDCGTNKNDLNAFSDMETNFKKKKKKKKEKSKTKCEIAPEDKQETKKDEGGGEIAGGDPLLYKEDLLKKEIALENTNRNKMLHLIFSANIERFSGSNLGKLLGYGIASHRNVR